MPAPLDNPVVSIVSMHFFNLKDDVTAVTAKTIMDGILFETDYFAANDTVNPIGRSVGLKDSVCVVTNYFDAIDTMKKKPIGCSVSIQDNGYSEINYFNANDIKRENPIGCATITQDLNSYTATYYGPNDPKRKNPVGTSNTLRDITLFDTIYTFKKPTMAKNQAIKTAAPTYTGSPSSPTVFAIPPKQRQPQTSAETQLQTQVRKKGGGCCIIS